MSNTADRRPHIAIYMNNLMMGGAERVILMLTRALVSRGTFDVDLLLTVREGPLLAEIPAGVRVVELGMTSPPALWASFARLPWTTARQVPGLFLGTKVPKAIRGFPRLAAYLGDARPDGLLTTLWYNNIAALWASALAQTSTRVVVREASVLSKSYAARRFDRRLPALIGAWYPRAAGIVAVCDGVAGDLARVTGLPRELITAIHNPVDVARIDGLSAVPPDDPWFADGQPPVLVAAGRLNEQKDYPTLLRAFAQVADARTARLVILGEGAERPALEQLASELGIGQQVRLPGALLNPFPYYRHAAAFVLSSAWEGFPNVLLEALACGCPVVSTDCPSGPAELLDGGRWGPLVPVGDVPALAAAILATLESPRQPEHLRTRAGYFSLDATLDRYLALLLGREAGDKRVA